MFIKTQISWKNSSLFLTIPQGQEYIPLKLCNPFILKVNSPENISLEKINGHQFKKKLKVSTEMVVKMTTIISSEFDCNVTLKLFHQDMTSSQVW